MNPIEIINLTPHTINLSINGVMTPIPSTGLARCSEVTEEVGTVFGVRFVRKSFGEVTGLPEPKANTIYIVSAIVLNALNGSRDDVFIPADCVRDEQGRIVGCLSLAN